MRFDPLRTVHRESGHLRPGKVLIVSRLFRKIVAYRSSLYAEREEEEEKDQSGYPLGKSRQNRESTKRTGQDGRVSIGNPPFEPPPQLTALDLGSGPSAMENVEQTSVHCGTSMQCQLKANSTLRPIGIAIREDLDTYQFLGHVMRAIQAAIVSV